MLVWLYSQTGYGCEDCLAWDAVDVAGEIQVLTQPSTVVLPIFTWGTIGGELLEVLCFSFPFGLWPPLVKKKNEK